MKTIQVEVTQDLINRGKANDCSECPVALALTPLLIGDVQVGDTQITVGIGGELFEFPLTIAEAQFFIYDFDAGRPVSPFSFELSVPEEVLV